MERGDMKKPFEIRWHGRGGLGAKTAALLLGEALTKTGKYIQAFPEYGPERRGAPVKSYNRVSDEPIRIHCGIKNPDVVVVLDPTLLGPKVVEGLPKGNKILINTNLTPEQVKEKYGLHDYEVHVVNATKISTEILGRNLPNTPMLGALIKVLPLLPFDEFLSAVEERLSHKFPKDIVEKNIEAIKRAYEEVM